jgi:hypothetical protein
VSQEDVAKAIASLLDGERERIQKQVEAHLKKTPKPITKSYGTFR